MNKKIDELKKYYNKKKDIIKNRLQLFQKLGKNATEKELFVELCFCLCTPQSKAKLANKAILNLKESNFLYNGTFKQIRKYLIGVRFPNNKAKYIVKAQQLFQKNNQINVRQYIKSDLKETRKWLVKNVKGFGYKEASHFLRNIGLGKDFAILDKHILTNMQEYNIIQDKITTITHKKYLLLEQKLHIFSQKIGISLEHLDLVFWSKQTGEVFK